MGGCIGLTDLLQQPIALDTWWKLVSLIADLLGPLC
jgi:hypothetical protein